MTKEKKVSVTFKKIPRSTGLAGVCEATRVEIKINKQVIGYMERGGWKNKDYLWRIHFQLKTKESMSGWCWASLRSTFKEEEDARAKCKEYLPTIIEKIYFEEGD